ncbi:MAG: peptide chain release factor 2 [Planctomycetes bacterium]|nr:peptide chain release factor 2 [Planctomycetota bacterium]
MTRLEELLKRIRTLGDSLDLANKDKHIAAFDAESAQADFWNNPSAAQKKIAELKHLKATVTPFREVLKDLTELIELTELAESEKSAETLEESARELDRLADRVQELELQVYLSGDHDANDCFLNIHAGTGGTDACDWAEMLLRLYSRYCDHEGWKAELIDSLPGDEAGIRRATLHVKGAFAFGFLKSEIGVHRLVRISPFDSNKRRHTSFAAIDVVPELEEAEIKINEQDLKIDTFSAGGPGGQHVNKTASAIRITHLPTGIVVQCQNNRSQHQNKSTAMKLLAAKLYALAEKEKEDAFKKIYGAKGEIAWGYQIRSYVLQPYTMVKDHRTDYETGSVQKVLDGEIGEFIKAFLRTKPKPQITQIDTDKHR